jgi:serine/threonine protein kinase/tetratricopeptide (TPR) repeat protein
MVGQTISHYTISEKLGCGGMGVVFKAVDQKLDRVVALKFLPPSYSFDEDIKKRFIQEAKVVSKLQHNNICTIHEINETEEGQLFICMDYYEGKSLKEKLEEKGSLELNEALDITIQICEGLKNAHEKNIVHRDIKPANIFITNDGIVKILDFGLAKIKGESQLTKTGSAVGTTAYMSPEQAKGENIDQRTDIWSLGVVFYEMISGKLPFKGEYDQAMIYSILNKSPEELNTAKKIKKFINICLQKKPANRYQSIDEILVDFNLLSPEYIKKKKYVKRNIFYGLLKNNRVIKYIGFIVLILSIAVSWIYLKGFSGTSVSEEPKQVAVLPLVNIGDDPSSQSFCDGLVETLTSQLTQLPEFNGSIQVIPASEIRQRQVASAKEASQIFGADLAVTGSIQKYFNKIRLILNLVDTKSLRQISSSIDDYSLSNVYTFQDQVVTQLADMLEVKLKPEEMEQINDGVTGNTDAYVLYTQGRGYLQKYWDTENINNAIRLFHEALIKDPKYAYAFAGLGEAFIRKYRNEKEVKFIDSALVFSRKAEKLNKDLAVARITSGIILNEKGNYKEASLEFKKAIELDKFNSEAYNGLAESYFSLNLNNEAEFTYKQAIKLKPSYWVGYNCLGMFYYSHVKFNNALDEFKKVVELTPDNSYGLNNLGSMYMYLEKWGNAKNVFKQVLKLKPDFSAYSNLGSIYFFHEEDFKNAADMFGKALKIDSSNYILWGNLAAAYFQIPGYKEKSYECYKQAIVLGENELQINPNNSQTLSILASYYSMLKNKERAIQYLEKSSKLSPDDIDIAERGIETYETLGLRSKALSLTDKILKKGYPISKLEKSPDLKNLIKDKKFEELKKKFSDSIN